MNVSFCKRNKAKVCYTNNISFIMLVMMYKHCSVDGIKSTSVFIVNRRKNKINCLWGSFLIILLSSQISRKSALISSFLRLTRWMPYCLVVYLVFTKNSSVFLNFRAHTRMHRVYAFFQIFLGFKTEAWQFSQINFFFSLTTSASRATNKKFS